MKSKLFISSILVVSGLLSLSGAFADGVISPQLNKTMADNLKEKFKDKAIIDLTLLTGSDFEDSLESRGFTKSVLGDGSRQYVLGHVGLYHFGQKVVFKPDHSISMVSYEVLGKDNSQERGTAYEVVEFDSNGVMIKNDYEGLGG